jgi:signal transduction histidine kinase
VSTVPQQGMACDRNNMTSPQYLQQLLAINLALTTSSSEELLELIRVSAADLTVSESASLFLLDPTTGELFDPGSTADEENDSRIPLEGSVGGWIVRRGEPLVLDVGAPELGTLAYSRSANGMPAKNLAAVPLETRARVLGVLQVTNKRDATGYDHQDLQLLKALASLAAMASDNDQLLRQTDLIAEFMHEVKTPLMALTAASELLARDSVGEKQLELIEMIQRETMRLSAMAQDFLDLSRLEAGRSQLAREPVDLAEIIYDVLQLQEPQAASRGISITVNADEGIPPILGDYDRLRQVFLNLTSNAIKYNHENGQININVCRTDHELEVEIADTGPGIAAEYLPHLFERFYRIPDSEGFTKGTGLGLSIAVRLLREHGGRIEVQSELGKGSTFRCYLPMQI